MVTVLTLLAAATAAAAALVVVLSRDVLHGALALIVVLLALAGVYAGLGAFFIAAVQVIVYAGAIMVLFLFSVMVLEARREHAPRLASFRLQHAAAALAGLALLAGLAAGGGRALELAPQPEGAGSLPALSHLLFGEYLLPFELTGLLLLVAVVAVMTLARREDRP